MAKWIAGSIKHPGRMKRAAKRAGESTHEYMEDHKHDSGSLGAAAREGLTLEKISKHRSRHSKVKSLYPSSRG